MIPDTPSSAASGMVDELRAAILRGTADEVNGQPNGNIITKGCEAAEYVDPEDATGAFVDAIVDEIRPILSAKDRELAALDDELAGERWHADEAARQRDVWKDRATSAERARDEALSALREKEEAQGYAQLAAAGWELESARLKSTEAEIKRLRAMEAAFQKPFSVLFLDGRNEHGTHVLPCLPTNLPPEYESDLVEQAEEIMVEAERLGFKSGEDMVWSVWTFNQPQYGDEGRMEFPGYWEFVGIDVPMSEWLRAQSALENGPAGLADATQNPSVSREQRGEEA